MPREGGGPSATATRDGPPPGARASRLLPTATATCVLTLTTSFGLFYGQKRTCVDVCRAGGWTDEDDPPLAMANATHADRVEAHCKRFWTDALPTISFTGALAPELYVFAVGFALTASIGFVGLVDLHDVHATALVAKPCCSCGAPLSTALAIAFVACVSLFLTGALSVADHTTAHSLAAALFFIFATIHTLYLWVPALRLAAEQTGGWRHLPPLHVAKLCVVGFGAVVFIFSVVSFALVGEVHYARRSGPLAQWLYVSTIALAFGVHTLDAQAYAASRAKHSPGDDAL